MPSLFSGDLKSFLLARRRLVDQQGTPEVRHCPRQGIEPFQELHIMATLILVLASLIATGA